MKASFVLSLIPMFLLPSLGADEPVKMVQPKRMHPVVSKMAWVGLEVAPLSSAMRAHAVDVPKGVGFLVSSVVEGGPAAKAGVKSFDILWKFNDQLLVNEAQFGTLLQMHRPGDAVHLGVVRSGQHEQLELELGEAPDLPTPTELSPLEIPLVPMGLPGLPRSIVYPKERKAVVSREDGGTAELRHEEGEALVLIKDAEGEVLYDGPLKKDGKMAVPKEWRPTVGALMRTMHQAKSGNWQPRRPRPRVVVPPTTADR